MAKQLFSILRLTMTTVLAIVVFLWLMMMMTVIISTEGHIEDICVAEPGPCAKCGVYNFYTLASRLGCRYLDESPRCVAATLLAQSKSGFADTSVCRGIIHFNAIYFIGVALGFKQEIAHAMASFSQSIDFVQYRAVDSCGRNMSNNFWTPPMRGLLRTETTFGGTNMHLGVPWVGMFDNISVTPSNLNSSSLTGPPLTQRKKIYAGTKYPLGCKRDHYRRSNAYYARHCPGLDPNFTDIYYDGALGAGRRWAFGETDVLCIAGMTIEDKTTGSIFTGKACPRKGRQYTVDIGPVIQGPIPLTGPPMELGPQIIHFECTPNCTAPSYTIIPGSEIYSQDFKAYLQDQSKRFNYATLNDPPGVVPELVARFGIYLHWVADRASHWYCCDASESGLVTVREGDHFNSFMYLSTHGCNFINHGMVHYWEQAVNHLAPGSYFALVNMYRQTLAFRKKFLSIHPEWFRPKAKPLKLSEVVGTKQNPGILYKITNIVDAEERFRAEVHALKMLRLPPMPGFEQMCKQKF